MSLSTETPVNGMTVHKMNETGRHEVKLSMKWGTGKGASLKGEVWVYIPLTQRHASLSLTNATLTPPGEENDLIVHLAFLSNISTILPPSMETHVRF